MVAEVANSRAQNGDERLMGHFKPNFDLVLILAIAAAEHQSAPGNGVFPMANLENSRDQVLLCPHEPSARGEPYPRG